MSQTTLNERNARLDYYLQQQMRKTGNQVRLIDLFTCSMKLFAGMLGGLFLLAIVDGWIVELAGWARWLGLLLILGGAATYFVMAILPLLIRKINPVYAARVVEESQPDMKNSLINYLLLKQQQSRVSRRIVEIVGSKAANDISGVPVENTVDKSHTIKAALVLTALVLALGVYKVVSPKDPFQSFARIIAPASAITKPARVNITQVEPGNTEVFFGQQLQVSAFIDGAFDPESAKVVFSTLDGQIVDGTIRMRPGQRDRYTAMLSTGDKGIEQSLRYRVVAGDGVSNEYTVSLTSSPILTVERITYDPAPYMELASHTVEGVTTIDATEGTTVTLDAVANTNIKSCYLQLLREDGKNLRQVSTVSMDKIDDRKARCQFRLMRNSARNGDRYTHYQLHLITEDGSRSQPIAANRILVRPDRAPEIQIDDPQETELEVPANSRLRFQFRANDLDFKLSGVSVAVEDGTRRLVEEDLEIGQQAEAQINKLTWEFWPKKSLLKAGDIAEIQFAAFDNRESEPGKPEPNMTLTERYRVTITDPIDNPPSEKPQDKSDSDENQSDEQGDQGEQGEQGEQGQSGDSGQQGQSGESGEGEGSESQEGGEQGEQSQSSEGSEGEGDSSQGESGEQSSSSSQGEQGAESTGQGESQDDSSESSQGESSNSSETGGEGGDPDSNTEQSDGQDAGQSESQDAGSAGQESSSQTGQNAGEQASENQSAGQGGEQADQEPLGENAHDSQIFDEIQKFREQQQSEGQDQGQSQDSQDSNQGSGEQGQAQNQDPSSGNQSQGSPENGSDSPANQESAQSSQQGSQDPESSQQQGDSGQAQQEESQTGDQQGQQESSSQSPETDDQGMDQQGQSDAQSNNEGQSEQEAGQSGQSDQEQNNQSGSESGDEQSSGGNNDSQSEEQQQQQQESGGSDSQESEQQTSSGGGNQDEQTGSGGGEQETSGSQQGEQGQEGQQQGESGSQSSSGDPQISQNQSDSGSQEQSGSGEQGSSGEQSSDQQSSSSSEGQQQGSSESQQGDQSQGDSQNSGQQDSQSSQGQDQGQSGNQQSEQGNQQSGQSGSEDQQGNQQQQGSGQQTGSGGDQGQQKDGQPDDQQGGGNNPGAGGASNQASNQSGNNSTPPGEGGTSADEANMEFTRKATDMALEYLEDQQIEPDPKLLDKLNWTDDDLRDFVKRWKQLKQAAASGDENAQRQYERALESLGLGQGDSRSRRFEGQTDNQQGYQEDGRVDAPPPEFADRYRAFSRERNKVRDER